MAQHTRTTNVIQAYLDRLSGSQRDLPADPEVRELLGKAAARLHALCGALLFRSYPRLTRPPFNLQTEEMLSSVVERLIKALREARPATVRQFFHIANQHMRWELNDLARRLDEQARVVPLPDDVPALAASSASQLSPVARRLFEAIDALPEEEREVFSLIRLQGMNRGEAAEVLGVSVPTVQRRLSRALIQLNQSVGDLRPEALLHE